MTIEAKEFIFLADNTIVFVDDKERALRQLDEEVSE